MATLPKFHLYRHRGWYYAAWREGGTARRRALRTKDRLIAEQTLKAFIEQYEIANRPAVITVEFCWNGYLETLKGRPAFATMGFETRAVLDFFGDRDAESISEEDCKDYRDRRTAQGRSNGTIWTELGRLRSALKWAERKNLIVKAPAIYRPPMSPPRDLRLTREQAASFLAACSMPHVRLFVILALSTGARMGALLSLSWGRVDFDGRLIDFHDSARQKTKKGRPVVPINRTLMAALQEARASALTPYVIEWGGRQKPVKSIRHALASVGKSCGLPWVTAHVFRHSVASWLAEDGVSMEEIAELLGHADSRTTRKTYVRFSPDFLRRSAEALEIPSMPRWRGLKKNGAK